LYLLLGKNLVSASYIKALEFRNGKSFRRVAEEGYGDASGCRLPQVMAVETRKTVASPQVWWDKLTMGQ